MTPLAARVAIPPTRGDCGLDSPVVHWLLEGPAQLRSGAHTGAVVGAIDREQHALYAYPEITGYFLQWLAWRAARRGADAALRQRAVAAQVWLRHWLAHAQPATRIHLRERVGDWRNDASFCFDIAMVVRGLGSAASRGLLNVDAGVVAGLSRELERLVAEDGVFVACRLHESAAAPSPQRWSTRRGGFLAKAAAGIITGARHLPGISARVVRAAEATFSAALVAHVEAPHVDVHPLLYTFEGILGLPQHPRFHAILPSIAGDFERLLAQMGARGQIPESVGPAVAQPGPCRVDVIAQTLRVGQWLGTHRPQCPPDRVALARLRRTLLRQVAPSGAVPFALDQTVPQWNVWAAMFVDQALAPIDGRGSGAGTSEADPLIV